MMTHIARTKSLNEMKQTKRSHLSISTQCDYSSVKKKIFKPLIFEQDNGENTDCKPTNSSSSKNIYVHQSTPIKVLNLSDQLQPTSDNHEQTDVRVNNIWHKDLKCDYKMSSKPRGPCLIVNNVNFEDDIFPKRRGSDKDASRLKNVFEQLGFDVQLMRDLTSHRMKSFLMQASASCKYKYDALVVILLSHGTESAIYGTDGIEMDLNDIISLFDNKRCKQMIGKPKVFIVQACRGSKLFKPSYNYLYSIIYLQLILVKWQLIYSYSS